MIVCFLIIVTFFILFYINTVNVDIFGCLNFRAFPIIGNFARIYFCVFDIIASM